MAILWNLAPPAAPHVKLEISSFSKDLDKDKAIVMTKDVDGS